MLELQYPSLQELFSLDGKVALVIGGDGHLGTPTSEALAEAGARVAIASINLEGCQELAERLGSEHMSFHVDVNDEDMVRDVVDQVADEAGSLDILVNMAHSGSRRWRLDEVTAEDFAYALQIGLTSYFVAAQQTWRHMKENGGGSIINIGSMYGMVSSYPQVYEGLESGGQPAYYQAAKAGVLQLTRHLATYWAGDGIRVNSISPGVFCGPQVQENMPEFVSQLEQRVPLGRIGSNWEMKGAIVFCASDASSYVTGHNLVVDGGWTIW